MDWVGSKQERQQNAKGIREGKLLYRISCKKENTHHAASGLFEGPRKPWKASNLHVRA